MLLDKVESEVAQHREVLGGIARTDAALVLVESNVEDPVELILDAPVAAHRLPESFGLERRAQEIGARLDCAPVPDASFGFDHPDGPTPWPLVSRLPPTEHVGIGEDSRAPTRLTVSCEGRPWGSSRSDESHLAFAFPNSLMSFPVSAPQIRAPRAIVLPERKGCRLVRSTRGSSSVAKCSPSPPMARDFGMANSRRILTDCKLTSYRPSRLDASALRARVVLAAVGPGRGPQPTVARRFGNVTLSRVIAPAVRAGPQGTG